MEKVENNLRSFRWEGINRAGEKVNGIIDAKSLVLAKADLYKQGYIVKKIVKKRNHCLIEKTEKSNKQISPFLAANLQQ